MTLGRRWFTVALALVMVVGGTALALSRTPYGAAILRSRDQFVASSIDPRVLYEPGSEHTASLVAECLPASVATVEEQQHLPLDRPFKVYVCSTQESFNAYMGAPAEAKASGVKVMNDIFISPQAFGDETGDSCQGVLTHELSHLQLYQRMGHRRTLWDTPPWFLEGLAVMVSGAGGRGVTDDQALAAIVSGHHFVPDDRGSFLRPKRAADYGIGTFMFYRQSELFVRYLRDEHVSGFREFLLQLQSGQNSFADAFAGSFGVGVAGAWDEFERSVRSQSGRRPERQE